MIKTQIRDSEMDTCWILWIVRLTNQKWLDRSVDDNFWHLTKIVMSQILSLLRWS